MSTIQPDYSPQVNLSIDSPASPTPPSHHRKSRNQPSSAKSIIGIALISILIAGALLYANQVIQEQTSTAPKADVSNTIDLKLERVGSGTIAPQTQFEINVIADDTGTSGQKVAAFDLTFIPTNLEITKFEAGEFFNVTGRHPANNPNLTSIVLKNATASNRFALGAACDQCCVGGACTYTEEGKPPITYEACSPDAACYPQVANNQVIATITVKALAAGPASLGFKSPDTKIAVINGTDAPATSAHRNLTALNLTVGGTSLGCAGADISVDGITLGTDNKVSSADYSYLISKWTGSFTECPTGSGCAGADISVDGITLGTDNKVSSADYSYLISKWTGSFTECQ